MEDGLPRALPISAQSVQNPGTEFFSPHFLGQVESLIHFQSVQGDHQVRRVISAAHRLRELTGTSVMIQTITGEEVVVQFPGTEFRHWLFFLKTVSSRNVFLSKEILEAEQKLTNNGFLLDGNKVAVSSSFKVSGVRERGLTLCRKIWM